MNTRQITIKNDLSSLELQYPTYASNGNNHEITFRTDIGQGDCIQVEKLPNGFKVTLAGDWEAAEFFDLMEKMIEAKKLHFDQKIDTNIIISVKESASCGEELGQSALFEGTHSSESKAKKQVGVPEKDSCSHIPLNRSDIYAALER